MASNFSETLMHYWTRKKSEREGFSLRSAAKKLKMSPGFLSDVLRGNKRPSPVVLSKIIAFLEVEQERVGSIWSKAIREYGFEEGVAASAELKTLGIDERPIHSLDSWIPEDRKKMTVVRQWFYLAIMQCLRLQSYDGTNRSLAKMLKISETSVSVALNDLQLGGLVEVDENGFYRKSSLRIRFSDTVSKPEIRKLHGQFLDKAKAVLENDTDPESFQKRLITGITLSTSSDQIEWAKAKLAECLHEIANAIGVVNEKPTHVYQLALQFFPLAEPENLQSPLKK